MPVIHVAVAVIEDEVGRVLLARRHADAHQGGLWEFPGGKLDAGETIEQALLRECREELGIELLEHRPLIRISHHYPDRSVRLDVHKVSAFRGEPHGMEGQPLVWAAQDALLDYEMPAADLAIVNAIRLPTRYLITPDKFDDPGRFLDQLQQRLAATPCLVQLRLSGLSAAAHEAMAHDVLAVCLKQSSPLLVNADMELARRIGAAGVHLKAQQLQTLTQRPQDLEWVAASCHSGDDLQRAAELGLDFAVLSPVLPTASHPGATTLGWRGFSELVDEALIPVFALGGMDEGDLQDAWEAGAQGIAAIRGLWSVSP